MSRLVVLTTSELAVGYRLAGSVTLEGGSPEHLATQVEGLLATEDGVVAIHAAYFHALPRPLRVRLESTTIPLVVPLPAGDPAGPGADPRQRLLELLRQAVGYQITFGDEESAS
jgi:vacuolar-type H+-ATPase subunit F/Vma7